MSGREWKPGDVAVAMMHTRRGPRLIRRRDNGPYPWEVIGGDFLGGIVSESAVVEALLVDLVVIDPDDREQVERLVTLLRNSGGFREVMGEATVYAAVRQSLRSLIEPPKPEEPTGDGAVVEDRMGHRWVRIAGPEAEVDSKPWRHRGHTARTWAHVNAVRVLSEGVQP